MASTVTDVIDGVSGSTAIKAPVKAASTTNVTLSGEQTHDGVSLVAGDRFLAKDQTTATENGIYNVSASAWSRAADFDGNRDVKKGTLVLVNDGTANQKTQWRVSSSDPITIGTSSISFENVQIVAVGTAIEDATEKTTPVDADLFGILDSAASNVLKKLTWANIKATLLTYFTTLFTRRVGSIQNLRDSGITTNIYVQYHTTAGDGGGGFFRYVSGASAGTYTDNEGTIIVPTGGDGSAAWLREYSGDIKVTWFGATGDGSTDDTDAIQDAINAANTAGGGIVFFPEGTYIVGSSISLKDKVELRGVPGGTTLKAKNGTDTLILRNPDRGVGNTPIDTVSLYGIIFDGNKANALASTATSAVAPDPCRKFRAVKCIFQNATGYGLGFQSYDAIAADGPVEDVYLEDCQFNSNGDGVGGTTYDGIDIKDCKRFLAIGCRADGNTLDGFDLRGAGATFIGCSASNNGGAGLEASANAGGTTQDSSMTVIGGEFHDNTLAGIRLANGSSGTGASRFSVHGAIAYGNATYGIEVINSGTRCENSLVGCNTFSNDSHGIALAGSHRGTLITACHSRFNTGSGVYNDGPGVRITNSALTNNTRYGYEEGSSGTRAIVGSGCDLRSNTIGAVLLSTNKRTFISPEVLDFEIGSGDIIASAATITLPEGGKWFAVTGTTTIDNITASWRGRVITLGFTEALTVTHNASGTGNIRLSAGGNKTTANRHTLTLTCDNTTWYEVAYSANT